MEREPAILGDDDGGAKSGGDLAEPRRETPALVGGKEDPKRRALAVGDDARQ
ncbi:MAG: hypothetical protein ACREQY_13415 [Candidatus Binatia bacterium]